MDYPPVLFAMADMYGTLAAVRCLGAAGVPVTVAEGRPLAMARWSRYVTRRTWCPNAEEPTRFLEWLVDFGRENPRHLLFPTSDDLAWLYAQHQDELRKYYFLYAPPAETMRTLLDKSRLQAACSQVGIRTAETWLPDTEQELSELAPRLDYPVLIKPRTQVFSRSRKKGQLVYGPFALQKQYPAFARQIDYNQEFVNAAPDVTSPMLQRYYPDAATNIYGLSAFIDESAEVFVVRASRKILQRPKRLGIGLCFEHAEVVPALAEALRRLCQSVGFFGIVETEFIEHDGDYLMIDFNPRTYNQLAFDIARGLPLPRLFLEAALGHDEQLRTLANAAACPSSEYRAYCHRFMLGVTLRAQTLTSCMSRAEAGHWIQWRATHQSDLVEAVCDPSDRLPEWVDAVCLTGGFLRHPRAFLRTVALDH